MEWKPPDDAEVVEESTGGWTPPADAVVVDTKKKSGDTTGTPSNNVSKTGGEGQNLFNAKLVSESGLEQGKGPLAPKQPPQPNLKGTGAIVPQQEQRNQQDLANQLTSTATKVGLDQLGAPVNVRQQPSEKNTPEQNYDIEFGNILQDADALLKDREIYKAQGDQAGYIFTIQEQERINQQARELLVKYPDVIDKLQAAQKEQERVEDFYSGPGGKALLTGARFQNAMLGGVKKTLAYIPKQTAQRYGNEPGDPNTIAYKAIEDFFDSPAMKFADSKKQFQKEDGSLDWSMLVPAVGETAGNMLALLGTAEMMGGSAPALFASSFAMTRNDYYDLAKSKGLTGRQADNFADVSAGLTSMIELVSPNKAVFGAVNKSKLVDDYVKELAKGGSASAKRLLVKELGGENIQEISQLVGDKVVQSGADLMTGSNKFDPDYFDANEYLSTIALTTITTGLVTGKGVINESKTSRANALAELARNPEKTAEIIQAQVENNIITPEEGQSVLQQVQRHAEAAQKVPDAIPEDKRADVTEMVAEKTDIENSIKDKDPALTLRQQERVEEINNELTGIASPELLEEEKTAPKGETKTNNNNGEKNAQGEGNQETRLLTPQTEDAGSEQSAPVVERPSILNQETDLKGGAKSEWMQVESRAEERNGKEVTLEHEGNFEIEKKDNGWTVYEKNSGLDISSGKTQKEAISNSNRTLSERLKGEKAADVGIRSLEEMRKSAIRRASNKGLTGKSDFEDAISDGRMTANDAKAIIESAGIEVPADILQLSEQENEQAKAPPNIEEATPVETTETETGVPPTTTAGTVLTDAEKSNMQSIAEATGDNFRLIENTIRKYIPDVPIETATAEDYNKAKAKREESKEGERKKKTLVTHRAYEGEVREGVKQQLEEIGLTRDVDNLDVAQKKAKQFVSNIGEDMALEAVRSGDISGATAAFVWNEAVESVNNKLATETEPEEITRLEKLEADLLEEWGNSQWKSGAFNSAMQKILVESDLGYNLQRKIQEYKDQNNGTIPVEVEAKFRKLDKELKDLNKRLAEAEERARKAEETRVISNIQESIGRESGPRERRIKEASKALATKIRKAKLSRPGSFSAASPGSLVWDGAVETAASVIEAGGAIAQAVADGIKFIKKSQWYKDLEKEKQKQALSDFTDFIEQQQDSEGEEIKVPHSVIREYVERGIDNIEDLTNEIVKELGLENTEENHRKVRDAITKYGKTVNLNKEEIEVQIRKMKRIGRVISALEDVAKKKRPVRSGLQRDKLDAEERALNKELREAMKELPVDEDTEAAQLRTDTDRAKQRLRNQIEDLQREIDKGEQVPKNARSVTEDEELSALREQRDNLKKEHESIFKDEEFRQAKRLEQSKKRAQRSIEDLQRKLREGDFSKKKKAAVISDSELTKLRGEKLRVKEEYDKEFYKNKLANRTKGQKIKDALWDIWGLTRVLSATAEFSFVGVQGLVNTIAHPIQAAQAFKRALQFFASEKKTEEWLSKLKAQEWYPELKQSKLAITEPNAEITAREELFYSGFADMVWNIPYHLLKKMGADKTADTWKSLNPLKAFERASVGYLDTIRVLRWLDGKEMLREKGVSFEKDPQAYKDMADVINTFTGRGSVTFGGKVHNTEILSKLFFSPRNWSSMLKQTILLPLQIARWQDPKQPFKPSVANKMALADYSKFLGLTTSLVMLAAAYLNHDDDEETGVELDPTSSDFAKIKLGNTRVDPWGGRIQQIILLARFYYESVKKESGAVIPLGVPYKTDTRMELLVKMATNKLSPSAAFIEKYLNTKHRGEARVTKYGKPYDMSEELKERLHPIFWGTAKDLLKDDPSALDGLLLFYAFFGGGVQVYEDKKKK